MHLLLLYWLCQSLWLCGCQQTGKFSKRWEHQTTLFVPWEISMQVKKQQLELDMEQQTGSKSEKAYIKVVYCHPAYLTYTQGTSCEMPGWMKHKLESRLPEEISITSDMQNTWPYGRTQRETEAPLVESERGEWNSSLKTQHSKNEDLDIWSHHFMASGWVNNGNSDRLYFLGLQNHCKCWLQPRN